MVYQLKGRQMGITKDILEKIKNKYENENKSFKKIAEELKIPHYQVITAYKVYKILNEEIKDKNIKIKKLKEEIEKQKQTEEKYKEKLTKYSNALTKCNNKVKQLKKELEELKEKSWLSSIFSFFK